VGVYEDNLPIEKAEGYPAFRQEALKDVKLRCYGLGISLLVTAGISTLGLDEWNIEILLNQLHVELGQPWAKIGFPSH
jgi:hypothetical protein